MTTTRLSRFFRLPGIFATLIALLFTALTGRSEDWTSWRGKTFDGRTTERNLPTNWSGTDGKMENVLWKAALPAVGRSTPVILDKALFLTMHDETSNDLLLARIDKTNGKTLWTRTVGNARTPRQQDRPGMREWQKFHVHHNLASPSVAADRETVVAYFGNGDLAAFDHDGKALWSRNLQKDYGEFLIWWGYANSPLLVDNLVIVAVMHDRLDGVADREENKSYLVAFDKSTGKEVWKTDRTTGSPSESSDSYTTPVLWNHGGRREMLVFGADVFDAYDPATGKRLWWIDHDLEGGRLVTMPVPHEKLGMVFGVRGKREPLFGAKPVGDGEQKEGVILWTHRRNVPDVSSMVATDSLLFFVDDNGVATCVDAVDGTVRWSERLLQGTYFPSLLLGDGKVYFLNNDGWCTVVKAEATFTKIAENKIDDDFLASPVVSDGKLYLRGRNALYCISE